MAETEQPNETRVLDPVTARYLPWLIAVAFFMQMLDGTILNTALPAIARELHESPLRMQGVVISYMLTVALLIPASGWIADRFGTKHVFFGAIALFTFGSFLCAQSNTLTTLILSRIVQGMGGALMVPIGRLVILRAYPRSELVEKLSFVTVPALLGPLVGPTLGGWMVDYASWHWIFLINIPIGIVGCLLTLRLMPDLRSSERMPFDWRGFILFSLALVLITISFEGLGQLEVPKAQSLVILFVGLGMLAAYWLYAAWTKEQPLFSLSLFKIRTFSSGIAGNIFARLGSGALPFLTPLFLQIGMGFSPTKAGMTMVPLALAAILGKTLVTAILERVGYRWFLFGNTLIVGCLIAGFSLISRDTPYVLLLGYLFALGAFNSMQFTAMNTVTLVDLYDAQAASGNSLLSVVMQLGMSLGIASASAIYSGFTGYFQTHQDAMMLSFHGTYLCVGLMSMVAAAIFLQLPKDSGKTIRKTSLPPDRSVPGPQPEVR